MWALFYFVYERLTFSSSLEIMKISGDAKSSSPKSIKISGDDKYPYVKIIKFSGDAKHPHVKIPLESKITFSLPGNRTQDYLSWPSRTISTWFDIVECLIIINYYHYHYYHCYYQVITIINGSFVPITKPSSSVTHILIRGSW